jgi:hypothetical protein
MGTIATFMHENFWNNATIFSSNGICGEGVSYYLPRWQNNTIKALMEYPALNGRTLSQMVVLTQFVMHEYRPFDISGGKH